MHLLNRSLFDKVCSRIRILFERRKLQKCSFLNIDLELPEVKPINKVVYIVLEKNSIMRGGYRSKQLSVVSKQDNR